MLVSLVQSVLRFDTGTLLFLLPYIVHAAVCFGTAESRDQVRNEILAVLQAAARAPSSHNQAAPPLQHAGAPST